MASIAVLALVCLRAFSCIIPVSRAFAYTATVSSPAVLAATGFASSPDHNPTWGPGSGVPSHRAWGATYISSIETLLSSRNHSFSAEDTQVLKQARVGAESESGGPTPMPMTMAERMGHLNSTSSQAVLVHVHIQKASGTALAATLSTACQCHKVNLVSPSRVHYTADHCRYCPKITGYQSTSPMTVNRLAGGRWVCGIHPPLDVMQACLRKRLDPKPSDMTNAAAVAEFDSQQLRPMYIVMLREPWARFLSEIKQAKEPKNKKGSNIFTGIADWQCALPKARTKISGLTRIPDRYIAQNRHLKMIGGVRSDFEMREQAGVQEKKGNFTRWSGQNTDAYRRVLLSTALRRLAQEPSILIGISEKFTEAICSLEVLYGHLYEFTWQEEQHSHNKRRDYNSTVSMTATAEDYEQWSSINKFDLALYEAATALFEIQFNATLVLMRERLRAGELTEKQVPHCLRFI